MCWLWVFIINTFLFWNLKLEILKEYNRLGVIYIKVLVKLLISSIKTYNNINGIFY